MLGSGREVMGYDSGLIHFTGSFTAMREKGWMLSLVGLTFTLYAVVCAHLRPPPPASARHRPPLFSKAGPESLSLLFQPTSTEHAISFIITYSFIIIHLICVKINIFPLPQLREREKKQLFNA